MLSRTRRDIQKFVEFLTIQKKNLDEDYWDNLKQVLMYLKGTKHVKLTLKEDFMSIMRWWVDVYFNTHEDFKFHTGSMMTLGKYDVVISSRKIK